MRANYWKHWPLTQRSMNVLVPRCCRARKIKCFAGDHHFGPPQEISRFRNFEQECSEDIKEGEEKCFFLNNTTLVRRSISYFLVSLDVELVISTRQLARLPGAMRRSTALGLKASYQWCLCMYSLDSMPRGVDIKNLLVDQIRQQQQRQYQLWNVCWKHQTHLHI